MSPVEFSFFVSSRVTSPAGGGSEEKDHVSLVGGQEESCWQRTI